MEKEKILIYYGGTFDPVHKGHIAIAVLARDYIQGLFPEHEVKVMLVPAPVPPHKTGKTISPLSLRFAMLELAVAGKEGLSVCNWEEGRSGKSYTCDSLALLQERYPSAKIFLLIGGDSLRQLHTWMNAHTLVRDFSILTFPRPGAETGRESFPPFWSEEEKTKLLTYMIPRKENELFQVSSTFLRENFYTLSPEVLEENLPPKAADFIKKHHLYT